MIMIKDNYYKKQLNNEVCHSLYGVLFLLFKYKMRIYHYPIFF